jgi:hypothetical protein
MPMFTYDQVQKFQSMLQSDVHKSIQKLHDCMSTWWGIWFSRKYISSKKFTILRRAPYSQQNPQQSIFWVFWSYTIQVLMMWTDTKLVCTCVQNTKTSNQRSIQSKGINGSKQRDLSKYHDCICSWYSSCCCNFTCKTSTPQQVPFATFSIANLHQVAITTLKSSSIHAITETTWGFVQPKIHWSHLQDVRICAELLEPPWWA